MTKLTKLLALLLLAATCSFANWYGGSNVPESTKKINGKIFYQISTPEELAWFATQVNSGNTEINAQLANDIVLWETEVSAENPGTRWKAIGDSSTRAFNGIFDGNGFKISGLYVNDTIATGADSISRGLFGVLDTNGVIKNLNVENAYIYAHVETTTSRVRYGNVGGIVGYSKGAVENVSFKGNVLTYLKGYYHRTSYTSYDAYGYVGGIVGYNMGSVKGVVAEGSAKHATGSTWHSYVGGIVGYDKSGKVIEEAQNKADVLGEFPGGIAGYVSSTTSISNCSNSGAVTDASAGQYYYSGGIVGYVNAAATISNCTNSGAVTASSSDFLNYSGGIVGYVNAAATISNCINSGAVTASSSWRSYSGGIVGELYNGNIIDCYNEGKVVASSGSNTWAGGVVGYMDGTSFLTNVYSVADIVSEEGSTRVGILVGYKSSKTYISFCKINNS